MIDLLRFTVLAVGLREGIVAGRPVRVPGSKSETGKTLECRVFGVGKVRDPRITDSAG